MRDYFVSRPLKAIFVHIPKTGGTAIKEGLLKPYRRMYYDREEFSNFFRFAMVRHPYTRIASHYRFRQRRDGNEFCSMSAFLQRHVIELAERGEGRTLAQTSYLADGIRVFRFEEMERAVAAICEALDIAPVNLRRDATTNYFGDYDWRTQFDGESLEFVNEHCAEDFDRFGYGRLKAL